MYSSAGVNVNAIKKEYTQETVKKEKELSNIFGSDKNIFADKQVETPTDAIIKAVAEAANSLKTKLIVIPTISGSSARLISNLEPSCPILALVKDEETANQLALNYGVYAKVVDTQKDMDSLVELSIKEAKEFMDLKTGDNIIVTGGLVAGKIGFTNLMKIETI